MKGENINYFVCRNAYNQEALGKDINGEMFPHWISRDHFSQELMAPQNEHINLEGIYLIFRYIENGICQEYYSGIYMRLVNETMNIPNISKSGDNVHLQGYGFQEIDTTVNDFYLGLGKTLLTPLAIPISDQGDAIYKVDSDFKIHFGHNGPYEKKIKSVIELLQTHALENLESSMKSIIASDFSQAYSENIIRDFNSKKVHDLKLNFYNRRKQ